MGPSTWPERPADAFYGLVGDIVRTIEPHTESDPAALLVQLLVAFGNVIGRGAFFMVGRTRHHTNLFAAIVGKSAKARKGDSWEYVRSLFAEIDPTWEQDRVKSGLSSGEGLIYHVRDDGEEDKRLLTFESEFASVLRVMEREGNTISSRLRDAWDRGSLSVLTKHTPMKATGAHISLVAHITQEELLRYLRTTETANGFANRILWICAKRPRLLPFGGSLTDSDLGLLMLRLRSAVDFAKTVTEVRRDAAADRLWEEAYMALSAETPGLLGAVTSRAEAQVLRVSVLYALLDESAVIRVEHVKAALALWRYCEASARYIFGDSLGDPDADAILAALRATPGGMNRTEISNLFNRNKKAWQIDRALAVLKEMGVAAVSVVAGTTKPAEVWTAI